MQEELVSPEQEVVADEQVTESPSHVYDGYGSLNTPASQQDTPEDIERARMVEIFRAAEARDDGGESESDAEADSGPLRGPDGKFVARDAVAGGEPEETEQASEAEAAAEDTANTTEEIPSYIPGNLREKWASIPEEAREGVSSAFKDYSDKLAAQGRTMQGVQPIYEKVVEAAKEMPGLANMTPQQIAQDVFAMARVQSDLNTNPVETLLKVAHQYGAIDGMKAKLEGHQFEDNSTKFTAQIREVQQENEQLKQQLAQARQEAEAPIVATIEAFASSKEFWPVVEDLLPNYIPAAQRLMGEGAEQTAILSKAYDMATNALGLKATVEDPETAPTADPKRTEAALKAKSVNVKSTSTGKTKPLTEREKMRQTYRRMTA